MNFTCFFVFRNLETVVSNCNLRKEEFTAFEQQDVRCREDLKHSNSKGKKLTKAVAQEKSRVGELGRDGHGNYNSLVLEQYSNL